MEEVEPRGDGGRVRLANWLEGVGCVVLDYAALSGGGTRVDPALGVRPVEAEQAEVLRVLHAARVRLVLASRQ
ncbi:hypothetical protein [Herbidospora sp. RD11066]